MTDPYDLIRRMAWELDDYVQLLTGSGHESHALAVEARNLLVAEPKTPPLPPDYIDAEHTGADRQMLEAFYAACRSEGGTTDEITLRGLRAVLAQPVPPPPHEPPVEGEVAELVARLGWIACQLGDINWQDDFETITRVADLLKRQQQMADLAADAVSALRYIEQQHGRLYGVGFNRVYEKADRLLPAHSLQWNQLNDL